MSRARRRPVLVGENRRPMTMTWRTRQFYENALGVEVVPVEVEAVVVGASRWICERCLTPKTTTGKFCPDCQRQIDQDEDRQRLHDARRGLA